MQYVSIPFHLQWFLSYFEQTLYIEFSEPRSSVIPAMRSWHYRNSTELGMCTRESVELKSLGPKAPSQRDCDQGPLIEDDIYSYLFIHTYDIGMCLQPVIFNP